MIKTSKDEEEKRKRKKRAGDLRDVDIQPSSILLIVS